MKLQRIKPVMDERLIPNTSRHLLLCHHVHIDPVILPASSCGYHRKVLQAVRTTPLVQQCQKAMNDTSIQHAVGLYWVPEHAGVQGNEIANELTRDSSVLGLLGPEPALGVSRQDIRRISHWLVNQHWVWYTLRRHLHLLGLLDSPLCRRCGAEEENSVHIFCECEALASLRHAHLGSFFLEPEDIKSISLGAIWNFSKVTGLP